MPTGCADLFTWQSRRVRLIADGGRVVDVLLCNGDKVEWKYLLHNDSTTAWRYSALQTKAAGETVYMPRSHDSTKAMWRGLEPLLVREPVPTTDAGRRLASRMSCGCGPKSSSNSQPFPATEPYLVTT